MKILTIRHGETDWNDLNKVQGATDNPLNEKGLEQARLTGRSLKGMPITRVYSSPLIRARQTTEGVLKELDQDLEVKLAPALAEQNFGIFEGWQRDDPAYQSEKHQYFKRFENGESFLDVAARVYPFLEEIITESDPEDVILLSTHGGICRMVASFFKDLDNEQFAGYFASNCEAQVYEVDEALQNRLKREKKEKEELERKPFDAVMSSSCR